MKWGEWSKGYTQAELDDAQEKFDLIFPPDLIALLREKRPVAGHVWTDEIAIRKALEWPIEGLLASVERGFAWRAEWGERPDNADARREVARPFVARAPKLIPLLSHRYLPEQPHEAGNPVLSAMYSDVIFYATNLTEYFEIEFSGDHSRPMPPPQQIKRIAFWSDLVRRDGWVMFP
ncbi:hypothetical protein [Bradyrhizobium sp. B120]|uniref:hypothetical protein n=1 Tax=Bradyrhizobium sp. B120 TaxID=3410088 RepID=UPI003B9876F6